MKYFAIFDKKQGCYQPQIMPIASTAEAIRGMGVMLSEGKGTIAQFPADFQLCMVGEFNINTGVLVPASEKGPIVVDEVAKIYSDYLLGRAQQGFASTPPPVQPNPSNNGHIPANFQKGGKKK